MPVAWYLTTVGAPTRRLHGPFATRAEAVKRSFMLLSSEHKYQAALNMRVPNLLVPTPVSVPPPPVSAPSPQQPPPAPVIRPQPRQAQSQPTAALPPQLFKLPEASLRFMAEQLDITTAINASRQEIIAAIAAALEGDS